MGIFQDLVKTSSGNKMEIQREEFQPSYNPAFASSGTIGMGGDITLLMHGDPMQDEALSPNRTHCRENKIKI
jgi:hypothetical protein